ncbi:hypothetical protein SAMN06298216_4425 [Spirosomataceae bacterium TFI 002]|nr:hypothetical protein SAMN06298216_4425 [Spirosomataceae bacterium TFI 002]
MIYFLGILLCIVLFFVLRFHSNQDLRAPKDYITGLRNRPKSANML